MNKTLVCVCVCREREREREREGGEIQAAISWSRSLSLEKARSESVCELRKWLNISKSAVMTLPASSQIICIYTLKSCTIHNPDSKLLKFNDSCIIGNFPYINMHKLKSCIIYIYIYILLKFNDSCNVNLLSVETRNLEELSVSPDLRLFTFTPW